MLQSLNKVINVDCPSTDGDFVSRVELLYM